MTKDDSRCAAGVSRWLCRAWMPLIVVGLLQGCGSGDSSFGEEEAQAYDPGLIQEPDFAAGGEILVRPWTFSQHAGETSYEYEIDGESLWIRRVGVEPWGRLSQRIPAYELEGVEALMFSLELRGALTDEWGDAFEPTGPGISIWGYEGPSRQSLLGPSLLVRERVELEPGDVTSQWERHEVCVELPGQVTRLEVSVVMSLGGELGVRRPSLLPVSADTCTPGEADSASDHRD